VGGRASSRTWVEGSSSASSLKRCTGRTIKIRNSGLLDSFACGGFGESLFDQRLIPLGLARSFACWARSGDRESGVNERHEDLWELRSQEHRFSDGFDPVQRNLYPDAQQYERDKTKDAVSGLWRDTCRNCRRVSIAEVNS
jgi:hypothetical protein